VKSKDLENSLKSVDWKGGFGKVFGLMKIFFSKFMEAVRETRRKQ